MPYYVLRTHSGITAQNVLWKVMSRPIKDKQTAEDWKDFCESEEKNNKHKFFIVFKEEN